MRSTRSISLLLATAMASAPLAACNDTRHNQPPPPVDDTQGGFAKPREQVEPPTADRPRMSTGKKVVILAGAAALYYMYRHHKNATAQTGADGQYYLSKNGRVYYRDAEHRAHWVTPPPGGIAVPESEAAEYRSFQGYNNQTSGRDLTTVAPDEAN